MKLADTKEYSTASLITRTTNDVNQVQQITFNGKRAIETGKRVVFITERCVFELRENGLTLTEIAPGINMERDIFAQMDYRPNIADDLKEMPKELFNEGLMGLKEMWDSIT